MFCCFGRVFGEFQKVFSRRILDKEGFDVPFLLFNLNDEV
jgi:hypothetical protein